MVTDSLVFGEDIITAVLEVCRGRAQDKSSVDGSLVHEMGDLVWEPVESLDKREADWRRSLREGRLVGAARRPIQAGSDHAWWLSTKFLNRDVKKFPFDMNRELLSSAFFVRTVKVINAQRRLNFQPEFSIKFGSVEHATADGWSSVVPTSVASGQYNTPTYRAAHDPMLLPHIVWHELGHYLLYVASNRAEFYRTYRPEPSSPFSTGEAMFPELAHVSDPSLAPYRVHVPGLVSTGTPVYDIPALYFVGRDIRSVEDIDMDHARQWTDTAASLIIYDLWEHVLQFNADEHAPLWAPEACAPTTVGRSAELDRLCYEMEAPRMSDGLSLKEVLSGIPNSIYYAERFPFSAARLWDKTVKPLAHLLRGMLALYV